MKMIRKLVLLAGIQLCAYQAWVQTNTIMAEYSRDTARVNRLLQESRKHWTSDSAIAVSRALEARDLARKRGYERGEGLAYKSLGIVFYFKGLDLEALDYWTESLKHLRKAEDVIEEANVLSNMGAVYANKGDDAKSLEYHYQALKLAESMGDKAIILKALNNIGGVYWEKKQTRPKAKEFLLKAFPLTKATGDLQSLGLISANLGEIYIADEKENLDSAYYFYNYAIGIYEDSDPNMPFAYNGIGKVYRKQGRFDDALKNHRKALALAEQFNQKQTVESYQGLANAYWKMGNQQLAFEFFAKAEEQARKLDNNTALREILEEASNAYAYFGQYATALQYRKAYDEIKDVLFDDNMRKKVGLFDMELQLEKKQGEVELLEKDQVLKEVEIKKQRLAKNAFTVGFVMVFLIAFIIFRNYRQKVKTNKVLDQQKDEIEHLLLNILPAEVAAELKVSGHATPRNHESVSVLFTDFKGFTTIADKMSPRQLVDELNECFIAFDEIIERNGLEKIKTIGDSYMCASGIPTPDPDHAQHIVKAAVEIQRHIIRNNEKRKQQGLVPWEVRVGVHSGPVVAGVVGKKKYAYDIWGSTVNIASRMESNGEPGKVNISAATYELVRDSYSCQYRGKIYAKNVGEIDMYFIDVEEKPLQDKPAYRVIPVPGQTREDVQQPAASGA